MHNVLHLCKPENALPVIFDSPHSGAIYPDDFGYACNFEALKACEDNFVDEIFEDVPSYGASFLKAEFPRSYIDPNRAIDDIDPKLLNQHWQGEINPTSRSFAGIGLIRRLVRPGKPVYNRQLSQDEIQKRIDTYYIPYHEALEILIEEAHYNYGQVWHINCHSMPNSTATPNRTIGMLGNRGRPSDFVVGDRDGTSCDPTFTRLVRDFLKQKGYAVTINDPFKGVELTRRYAAPTRGRHSIQLEINKALYMNEETGEKHANFETIKQEMNELAAFITAHANSLLQDIAAD